MGHFPLGGMRIAILQVGRAKAVTAALLIDLPEEHLRLALPWQLGELIDGSDQQGRQQAINLFIHHQYGQSFAGRLSFAEGTLSIGVAAIDKRAPAPLADALHFDVFAALDDGAAPGATGQLARRPAAAEFAAAQPVILFIGLFALLGGIGGRALANPQSEAERRRRPRWRYPRAGSSRRRRSMRRRAGTVAASAGAEYSA